MLDPSSAGRATENGNRIGAITLEGTPVLIIFGGLIVGLGHVGCVGRDPGMDPRAVAGPAALGMPIAIALTGFQLVRPENHDFRILAPVAPILALLLGLVAIAGFAFASSAIGWTGACHRPLPG